MTARSGTTPTPSLSLLMTSVVGLSPDNDETAYREEARDLTVWLLSLHLSFNVIKTLEMIVDYRKSTEHTPILINGAVVENLKFLGVHTFFKTFIQVS